MKYSHWTNWTEPTEYFEILWSERCMRTNICYPKCRLTYVRFNRNIILWTEARCTKSKFWEHFDSSISPMSMVTLAFWVKDEWPSPEVSYNISSFLSHEHFCIKQKSSKGIVIKWSGRNSNCFSVLSHAGEIIFSWKGYKLSVNTEK